MLKFGIILLLSLPRISNAFGTDSRRTFLSNVGDVAAGTAGILAVSTSALPSPVLAAPEIIKTDNGIKYAITKAATTSIVPQQGDIVAIEYTGYLSNGQVSCLIFSLPFILDSLNVLN